jgi:hypothetical protein
MNATPNRRRGRLSIITLCLCVAAVPALYVVSYFALGKHVTVENWGPRCTYHDREFPFDPWIYVPLAKFERRLRGHNVQVLLDGSPGRDGGVIYAFSSGCGQ